MALYKRKMKQQFPHLLALELQYSLLAATLSRKVTQLLRAIREQPRSIQLLLDHQEVGSYDYVHFLTGK